MGFHPSLKAQGFKNPISKTPNSSRQRHCTVCGREKVFPRGRVCVSPSPFERGHPATPRRRPGSAWLARAAPATASASAIRCGRRRLGSALTAASGDSSSEHDHSPRSLPVADSPVATPAALPRSRRHRLLPPLPACRLRSHTCVPAGPARPRG